jgi:hypothetical protein
MLTRLIQHVEGDLELSMSQCTTGLRLVDKILPSLQAVQVDVQVSHGQLPRHELEARLSALGMKPESVWNRLANQTTAIEMEPINPGVQQHDPIHVDKHDENQQPIEGTTPVSDESESSS